MARTEKKNSCNAFLAIITASVIRVRSKIRNLELFSTLPERRQEVSVATSNLNLSFANHPRAINVHYQNISLLYYSVCNLLSQNPSQRNRIHNFENPVATGGIERNKKRVVQIYIVNFSSRSL